MARQCAMIRTCACQWMATCENCTDDHIGKQVSGCALRGGMCFCFFLLRPVRVGNLDVPFLLAGHDRVDVTPGQQENSVCVQGTPVLFSRRSRYFLSDMVMSDGGVVHANGNTFEPRVFEDVLHGDPLYGIGLKDVL
jgi:hypothetical protein